MTLANQPNPHDLRISARQQYYPNREVESDSINAVDEAVTDKVRLYEAHLVDSARQLMESKKAHETEAAGVVDSLKTELRFRLMDGAWPTADLAARYEKLRGRALQARRSLAQAEADALSLARTAADPYKSITALWEKYPLIRPTL